MSWMEELVKTYDANEKIAGSFDAEGQKYVLPPVGHMTQQAQIEVTLDGNGNLCRASVVPKEDSETLIPCTIESANSRVSTHIAPHPLHDNLRYVAKDYENYSNEKFKNGEIPYTKYKKILEAWVSSRYIHPKVQAVYTYISKNNMRHDLINKGVLYINEDGSIKEKWDQ